MRRSTWFLAACAVLVMAAATPDALRDAYANGVPYVLSSAFLTDLPRRLTGPGRLRFVFQPAMAILLGIRAGMHDRRSGRPPYLKALALHPTHGAPMMLESFSHLANLVLMGIIVDMIAQWLILGSAYPGAALLVGPVLIGTPYAIARALANRAAGAGSDLETSKT